MPWKFATLGFVVVTSLLAGCSTPSGSATDAKAPEATATTADGRCDAEGGQFAVGKQASNDLLSQVRAKTGALDGRILGPNDMVTLEYRSERVNVNTDSVGMVVRVNCG